MYNKKSYQLSAIELRPECVICGRVNNKKFKMLLEKRYHVITKRVRVKVKVVSQTHSRPID